MTLQQLRLLREVVRQSFNITAAAAALNTSQPGVSRQIRLLEQELGMTLLVRQRSRVVGLTEAGSAVLRSAVRLLHEAENIAVIAEHTRAGEGTLTLATSHLHARYTLVEPFKAFRASHSNIRLLILQAPPDEILELVEHGEADIAVTTSDERPGGHPAVIALNGPQLQRSLIMPQAHALRRQANITLGDLAKHPMVGYSPRSFSGSTIASSFEKLGLVLQFVVRASDSDVIKSYVHEGLGIGIVPTVAVRDTDLGRIHSVDVTGLFPPTCTSIIVRRDVSLARHLVDFIMLVAPGWNRNDILDAVRFNSPDSGAPGTGVSQEP